MCPDLQTKLSIQGLVWSCLDRRDVIFTELSETSQDQAGNANAKLLNVSSNLSGPLTSFLYINSLSNSESKPGPQSHARS